MRHIAGIDNAKATNDLRVNGEGFEGMNRRESMDLMVQGMSLKVTVQASKVNIGSI